MGVDSLVSAAWLMQHATDPDVRIIDGSFKMPGILPSAREDYARERIPEALFFAIDDIADLLSPLPHMLPSPDAFAAAMDGMGISAMTHVVVYANTGILGAARVWWMLRYFGHENVSLLDGGFAAWKAAGGRLDTAAIDHHSLDGPKTPGVASAGFKNQNCSKRVSGFQPVTQPSLLCGKDAVLANLANRAAQVIDARAAGRFSGAVDEPRPGLRRGHIPGSINLDHASLTSTKTGFLKSKDALRTLFDEHKINVATPTVATCGSGISACSLAFALYLLGNENVAVYDGSWAEWGADTALPVELSRPTYPDKT